MFEPIQTNLGQLDTQSKREIQNWMLGAGIKPQSLT